MKFLGNEERKHSFEELKRRRGYATTLTLSSGSSDYKIYNKVSKNGLGYMLMKCREAITYVSHQLKSYEACHPTHEELPVVVLTWKIWHNYFMARLMTSSSTTKSVSTYLLRWSEIYNRK